MTAKQTPDVPTGFASLKLDPKLLAVLAELNHKEPTPIQKASIGPMLDGHDLIGQAATGTGKTAAFALPILHRLATANVKSSKPSALVLVPTRELAMQVADAVRQYGRQLKVAVAPVYGGHSFGQQLGMLKRGADVVVGTPGRTLDHIRRETLDLSGISFLVLDEADEMLDMGFAEDLEAILAQTPDSRQTVMFSATLPARITDIAKRHLTDPLRIQIAGKTAAKGTLPRVRQTAYVIPRRSKLAVLGRILDVDNPASSLVFCRTRNEVDDLTEKLSARGYRCQALHGGISQDHRSRVIKLLRESAIDLVVATDVAARGLDIENLSHVINYDVPTAGESYVHRIGRVGRAGREGAAVTLADPRESKRLQQFERLTHSKIKIAKVPTVADLRARRLELTRDALRQAAQADDLDRYRPVIDKLADDGDLMAVALAAVKLAYLAAHGEHDDTEIDVDIRRSARGKTQQGRNKKPHRGQDQRHAHPRSKMARIYVGAGKSAGILPRDLVGAIAGESGIRGATIGTISVEERYSIVELPKDVVHNVLLAMRKARIKGKKVSFRRFVER